LARIGGGSMTRRPRRTRVAVCAVVVVALTVSGCRSEPVEDTSGLRDLDDIPIEPEPEPEAEPDLEEEPSVDADADPGEADDIALDDEAWPASEVLSESAFEENEDLDLSGDEQRSLVRRYAEIFDFVSAALSTAEFDEEAAAEFLAAEAFEGYRASIADLRADGLVQPPDDTSISRIYVARQASGAVEIHHCTSYGSSAGLRDAATGELVFGGEPFERTVSHTMALVELSDGSFDWLAIESRVLADACE
jgi:hypothetical protein